MKFIDFFAGIGGCRLALEAAGHECAWSVEIDPHCRKVHEARFGAPPEAGDIAALDAKDVPDAELWVGGWPCQGLSTAGLRKGLADERSGLFWELVRLVEQKRPRFLLLENVPGLLSTCSCPRCGRNCKKCAAPAGAEDEACGVCGSESLGGRVLPEHRGTDLFVVLTALQKLGYSVQARILDAQFFGVPQRRRRIFFVAHLGSLCAPEVLFDPQGGGGDLAAGAEEGPCASRELARCVGDFGGGGTDVGAGKGNVVARPLTRRGHPDRGDGLDSLLPDKANAVTASAGHHGHSSPRGDGSDNLVAGTLQSCGKDQGRKTPEADQLVAPAVMARQGKGGFTDPVNDGLVAVAAPITAGSNPNSNAAGRRREDDENIVCIQDVRGSGRDDVNADGKVASAGSDRDVGMGIREDGKSYTLGAVERHAVAFSANAKASDQSPALCAGEKGGGKNDCNLPLVFENHGQDSRIKEVDVVPQLNAKAGTGGNNLPLVGERTVHVKKGRAQSAEDDESWGDDGEGPAPTLNAFDNSGESRATVLIAGKVYEQGDLFAVPINLRNATRKDGKTGEGTPSTGVGEDGDPASAVTETSQAVAFEPRNRKGRGNSLFFPMTVRQLTPTEAERLQGQPDGWTCLCQVRPDCPDRRIPPWLDPSTFRLGGCGHSACGCSCPDSPRYRALGNSVATPVIRWIGDRLAKEDTHAR